MPELNAISTPQLALFQGGIWEILGSLSFFGVIIVAVLLFMSVISWIIMINKYFLFRDVKRQSHKFISLFTRVQNTGDLLGQVKAYSVTPLGPVYSAGIREADAIIEAKNAAGAFTQGQPRLSGDDISTVNLIIDKTVTEQLGRLERYVMFLATTANAAPFLGLLGTIVGVMESFWSIGERGSASLVVVAPGIAEALLVIVIGLGAAIPAVVAYNWANNKLKEISDDTNNFGLEFMARLKKDNYR